MSHKRKKIRNLNQLDKEIHRQKLRAKELELKIDAQVDHFQDHFLSMAAQSLLKKTGPASGFIQLILENDSVQKGLQQLSSRLSEKFTHLIESFVSRFSRPKDPDN
jgi:hypothetical protein